MQEVFCYGCEKIIAAVIEYYKLRNNSDLARMLGVKPNTVATWEARRKVNTGKFASVFPELNPDWLDGKVEEPTVGRCRLSAWGKLNNSSTTAGGDQVNFPGRRGG